MARSSMVVSTSLSLGIKNVRAMADSAQNADAAPGAPLATDDEIGDLAA